MKICVIIPAYNESKAIGGLVRAIKTQVPDIIVIDDGSTDRTAEFAREAGATVISFKTNMGKGKALQDGFDYACGNNYDAVITADADGQHSPDDISGIMQGVNYPQTGIVVGNRMLAPRDMPPLRFITNLFMSLILSIICGQNIPDTQCGFRLIKCEVLRKIRLVSLNYEIESEMLIKASRLGYKIVSVPVKSVYEGQASLINPFADTWRFLVLLVRVIFTRG